jgi:tetratricopeptide (TPR) repeat protein
MIRWRDTDGSRGLISTAVKLELARRAARVRENSAPIQYALAAASFHVQDYDSGIAAFELGMRLDPPEPDSVAGYVKALLAKDRALEALDVLDRYADAEASSVKLLVQRGIALQRIGRLDAASEALREGLARRPTDVDAGMALQSLLASRKDWAGLLEFVENQARCNAITMPVMLAWVAGLVGLGRNAEAARLLDFDSLVLVRTIDPPDSFSSLSAFNAALARDVMSTSKIRLSNVPASK